jgi:hypothetical protein
MKATDTRIEDSLISAVSSTMQETAFIDANPSQTYWARLPLLTPKKGALIIGIPRELALELAENMLHMGPDDINDEVMLDVTAEFANTVAGTFLRDFIDSNVAFQLGLPEKGIGWPELEQELIGSYSFDVGDHTMLVVLAGHDFKE